MRARKILESLDVPDEVMTEIKECLADHEQMQFELLEKNRMLEEAQRIAKIGSWELNIAENRLAWSNEIFNIFEIEKECFGASYEAFLRAVHPKDRDAVDSAYKASLESKEPYEIVHRLLMPDGRIKYVHEKCMTHYDPESGKPLRSFGTVQDITERKYAEQEILKIQKLESLGVLVGGIAHDFNNLLAGIMGYASLIPTVSDQSNREKLVKDIINAARRAANLTGKLMVFAKGGVPEKALGSVANLIRESAEFSTGKSSACYCDLFLPDNLWPIEMDAGQISQVIQNLVINAKEAMPEGGAIKIQAENVELANGNQYGLKGGKFIHIIVTDSGMGIPEKYLDKIFDPYFTTKKREGDGDRVSGLGLAAARNAIKNHKGAVSVKSEQGKGTVFDIYLPASDKKLKRQRDVEHISECPSGLRILFMDDEIIIGDMAKQMFAALGHEAEIVRSGEEAIDMYSAALGSGKPFDLAVLDLTIPGGMGGGETLKRLRKMGCPMPIIVSSGYSDNIPDGFDGILTKPYSFKAVRDLLNGLISKK